jgi:hypothetical protein
VFSVGDDSSNPGKLEGVAWERINPREATSRNGDDTDWQKRGVLKLLVKSKVE